ncbi:MAG: fluoride efflux transporter CrcB [Alphaproteobacteria bacterium]
MKMILAIAMGGAVGAVARHFVAAQVTHWMGAGFPWGILTVNILGSFLLGVLIETMALVWSPTQEMRAFLIVGCLGAFTTFSAFAMDIVLLDERGQVLGNAIYIGSSVGLSVLALIGGLHLMRVILA